MAAPVEVAGVEERQVRLALVGCLRHCKQQSTQDENRKTIDRMVTDLGRSPHGHDPNYLYDAYILGSTR